VLVLFRVAGDNMGEIETFVARAGHVTGELHSSLSIFNSDRVPAFCLFFSADWHFDFMENFTFQLRGSKTWKMRKGDIPHPIRGCTPHYKTTEARQRAGFALFFIFPVALRWRSSKSRCTD